MPLGTPAPPQPDPSIDAVNLALGLPRLPRAARRQLASRTALHTWLLDLQRLATGAALARFLVARLSEWLPLRAWALVVPAPHGAELVGPAPRGPRLGPAVRAVADAALRARAPWSAASMRTVLRSGPDAAAVAWVLLGREEVQGVLVGIDDAPGPRPPDVVGVGEALWQDVLEPVGLALARVRHLDRLEALATIDDLTGLFNARHLQHTVERDLSRLTRTDRPLLALDAFKRVNDRHGHLLGSQTLVEVGRLLRACVRLTGARDRAGRRPDAEPPDLFGRRADPHRRRAMYRVKRPGRNGIRAVLLGRRAQKGSPTE